MIDFDLSKPDHVTVGSETFCYGMPAPASDAYGTPPVFKSRVLLEQLFALISSIRPGYIVELGIHRGGSAALVATAARPSRLVAVELSPQRAGLLDAFIDSRQMTDVVKAYYGLDQSSPRVLDVVDAEFGDQPLDLVLDDASHLYAPTRESFQMLFPRLRTEGVYVIEDWAGQHTLLASIVDGIVHRSSGWQHLADHLAATIKSSAPSLASALRSTPDTDLVYAAARVAGRSSTERPLSRLVQELVLMSAQTQDVIRRITVTQGWTEITRGAGTLDDTDWFTRGTYEFFPEGSQEVTSADPG